MNKTNDAPEIRQMFNVINDYDTALTLLDDYDHQRMSRPQGHETTYILTYDECRRLIETMRFNIGFGLFGHEKDDSFRGSIGDIYQTFAGKDVYLSVEEKAANLLYFVTKNHSFNDGNKRIAAAIFLYFLDRNGARPYFGINVVFSHPSGDKLIILTAEIENQNFLHISLR